MIYHYTSIQTLALILEGRRIRFNRLDRVDDIEEAQTVSGIKFGQYFFVSCWSRSNTEQIPLWKMYTPDMRGVMIGLSDQPFLVKELKPLPGMIVQGEPIYNLLTLEEMHGSNYMVLAVQIDQNKNPNKMFAGDVNYVDDVSSFYVNNVKIERDVGNFKLAISNVPSLVRTKSKYWSFQNEYRFALQIYPSLPIPETGIDGEFSVKMANYMGTSLLNSVDHGLTHFDLSLSPDALNQIQVTLGPLCTPGDRIIVEAMLEKFAKNGTVKPSALSGRIRTPLR